MNLPMLNRARSYLINNITRLPVRLGAGVMAVNRRPGLVFGGRYRAYRNFLRQNYMAYDNRNQLIASVNEAIRTIPYYRERYGDGQVGSVEAFEETLSFIDKDAVLENYEGFIRPGLLMDAYDIGTTGGTSGKPLTFIAPKSRYAVELATMHSLWAHAGYRFHMRAVIRNHHLPGGQQYIVNPVTREVIFDGFRLTDSYFEFICSTMRRMNIVFLHCYPSTAYEFALYLQKNGRNRPPVKAFLSGSENIFDYQRDLIENQLGIRFYNWYGHSEKLVLAGYCHGTRHYHAEPTYGYMELVDEDGRVIREPGNTGEIVGTSFHNPGMPFIRYRTGDYAEYVGDECAVCGRRLPIFTNVRGRWSGDRIYNADGTFVTTTALNLHNALYQAINGMQYVQERKGELVILIVKSVHYNEKHEAGLHHHFTSKLNPGTEVKIRYVNQLFRKPNGKFVQLLSNL